MMEETRCKKMIDNQPQGGKMDRSGSRSNQFLQTIERICSRPSYMCGGSRRDAAEDLLQLRFATGKIHLIITSSKFDAASKESFIRQNGLPILIMALRVAPSEKQIVDNIISTLLELLHKSSNSKYLAILVNCDACSILLQILMSEYKESLPRECLMMQLHQLLAKIGTKDPKFPVKGRLSQALVITLNLIKTNTTHYKNLLPLLRVLKMYSSNNINASYLVKNACIQLMTRIVTNCCKNHSAIIKHALEILCNLTKTKKHAVRAVNFDNIPTFLTMHCEWHPNNSKHKYVTERRLILTFLKNLTNTKSGKAAFLMEDGVKLMYTTAREGVDTGDTESLIFLSSSILRKCCPIELLPLDHFENLITFELPVPDNSDNHSDISCSEKTAENTNLDLNEEEETSDTALECLEMEDSTTTNDFGEANEEASKTFSKKKHISDSLSKQRSAKDLQESYAKFFDEINEEDKVLISCLINESPEQTNQQSDKELAFVKKSTDLQEKPQAKVITESKLPQGSDDTTNSVTSSSSPTNVTQANANISNSPHGGFRKSSMRRRDANRSSVKARRSNSCKLFRSYDRSFSDILNRSAMSLLMTNIDTDIVNSETSKVYRDFSNDVHDSGLYLSLARKTKSVYHFEKVPYPDYIGACSVPHPEPLNNVKTLISRLNLLDDIDRQLYSDKLINLTAFDIDQKIALEQNVGRPSCWSYLQNDDIELLQSVPTNKMNKTCLRFSSQFESGNLRKAIQVREYEYDLLLNSDVNANNHHQWFYFEVSNMKSGIPYKFNIINCEKFNSQFNSGMKPVMFSVKEAIAGRPYWFRIGKHICYYKNCYIRSQNRSYFTASFQITFRHSDDICYLAYHFPYTYSTLRTHLKSWEQKYDRDLVYFKCQELCETLSGNSVPILTITGCKQLEEEDSSDSDMQSSEKSYVFLSARVHPGESNSSWVMKGIIDFLLSNKPSALKLMKNHIFKIIPMINPDGVINGSHRCSLAGNDLNRRWLYPCAKLHPIIFHAKGVLSYMKLINKLPTIYCDLHGHSQKKNIFLYGCSPLKSWQTLDADNPTYHEWGEDISYQILPYILNQTAAAFSLEDSQFHVEEIKETSARVVVWRQLGVVNSYCMESTFCGFDQGTYRNTQVSTHHLQEMGRQFCEGILLLSQIPLEEQNILCIPSSPLSPNNSQLSLSHKMASINSDTQVDEVQGKQGLVGADGDKVCLETNNKDSGNSEEDKDNEDDEYDNDGEEEVDDNEEDEEEEDDDEDDDENNNNDESSDEACEIVSLPS
ncbi:cytosolic carboxypeptidase 1 isoform X2 [Octopus sinensis]|uniref:tubulin-glutamate carboxypeptidase n=1 Tax=Octopus sinensis TaxID=2607531 RepID=A0A6P7S5F4_9MOLL|nr:cytosolic carboxypeptidase 1 isoform X2 [Octopus sinensis]